MRKDGIDIRMPSSTMLGSLVWQLLTYQDSLLVPSSRAEESKNHPKMEFVFILHMYFCLHQTCSTSYVV
jgi:hypothetical protein